MNASRPASPLPRHGLAVAAWDASTNSTHELLEALDDAMFAAIGGDAAALESACRLWAAAGRELSREVVEESREQYLRVAAEAARRSDGDGVHEPADALAALDVIALLGQE
jgi:hypothetical protein